LEILLFLTIAAAGGALGAYIRDLRAGVSRLSGGGVDAMAAIERAIAISDLLSYAVLADGEVSEEESTALAQALRDAGVSVSADDAIARLRARAAELKDEATLRLKITATAAKLSAADRTDVFRHVVALAASGSGISVGETSYRSNQTTDAQRLVTVFSECLGIPLSSHGTRR